MLDLLFGLHYRLAKEREFPGLHGRIDELRAESELSAHKWEDLRLDRLARLLDFASRNVPYFRGLTEDRGGAERSSDPLARLRSLPVLTKALIRERFAELRAEGLDGSRVIENHTGGSTGVPLRFLQDHDYNVNALALDAFVREWWGIRPYERTGLIWGADQELRDLSFRQRLYLWRSRTRALNAFRMSDEGLGRFARMLKRWRPPYLMGYSSALAALARCVLEGRIEGLAFRAIRSSAEMLWPDRRRLIEEALGGP